MGPVDGMSDPAHGGGARSHIRYGIRARLGREGNIGSADSALTNRHRGFESIPRDQPDPEVLSRPNTFSNSFRSSSARSLIRHLRQIFFLSSVLLPSIPDMTGHPPIKNIAYNINRVIFQTYKSV